MFKLLKNDQAVSPVVATLVLIVVAIIGAAAVGMLMGTFSSSVADETSIGDTSGASSAELLVAGSTSVQPLSEILAEGFMKAHQGVKVTVSGGGSDVGIMSAGLDSVDIGSSSKPVSAEYMAKYPNLKQTEIGGSAIVPVVNAAVGATGITKNALVQVYTLADANGKVTIADANADGIIVASEVTAGTTTLVFQRADGSGTEDEFAKFLGSATLISASKAIGKEGNSGMASAIANSATPAIGFVDYGFSTQSGLVALGVNNADATTCIQPTSANIIKSLKGDVTGYPYVKNLYYITNGEPSALEQSYIDFATAPSSTGYFTQAGVISLYDINKV